VTDAEGFKREWDRNGFFVAPSLLDSSGVEELKVVCDDVLRQWIDSSPNPHQSANNTNMAFLTEPRYFEKNPQGLRTLLGAIGDHRVLAIVRAIIGTKPLFHNTQYFFNPASETRSGDWHRDQQFGAVSIEEEKLRMARTAGVHVHIAFLPDDNLEIVPGTHNRWDTPEELAIRRGDVRNSASMPNAHRVRLAPGDGLFFSAWSIHRGNYIAGVPRRTVDFIYGTEPGWVIPPPTCFLRHDVLDGLTARARSFFERYIETYKDRWLVGDYLE
jgi:hypothetical protein